MIRRRRAPRWRFARVAGPFAFTEGPVWDGEAVLFTDIPSNRIMRYDTSTGNCSTFLTNTEGANGLAIDASGRLYGCQGGGRRVVRYESDGRSVVLADRFEGRRLNSPNDVVVDPGGRIWFTDPRYGERREDMELDHESVYRLEPRPDGSYELTRATFDAVRPNGLALSADERDLYVADSPPAPNGRRQLRSYPIMDGGELGPARILHDFGRHRGIDGMRIDEEGSVVAACGWRRGGRGPRVAVFSASGRVIEEHPTPTEPTNLCFGGPELRDLYLTGYDGSLWRARTHRRGLRVTLASPC